MARTGAHKPWHQYLLMEGFKGITLARTRDRRKKNSGTKAIDGGPRFRQGRKLIQRWENALTSSRPQGGDAAIQLREPWQTLVPLFLSCSEKEI
jgi:hypothetical protein